MFKRILLSIFIALGSNSIVNASIVFGVSPQEFQKALERGSLVVERSTNQGQNFYYYVFINGVYLRTYSKNPINFPEYVKKVESTGVVQDKFIL